MIIGSDELTGTRMSARMLYEDTARKLHPWNSGFTAYIFLARDVIYTSRAYATMSVSVCLSVCNGSALAHYS